MTRRVVSGLPGLPKQHSRVPYGTLLSMLLTQADHVPAVLLQAAYQAAVFDAGILASGGGYIVGVSLGVDGKQVVMGLDHMLDHMITGKLPQIHGNFNILVQILVDGKQHHFIPLVIINGHGIDAGNIAEFLGVIGRGVHQGLQGDAPAVLAGEPVGIIDGLPPATGVRGHDGGNDIDQLSQTSHLHPVGMAQHGDQHRANQQRILEVVHILQLMGRMGPLGQVLILLPGMIPDIPLVEGQIHSLVAVLFGLDTHPAAKRPETTAL